MFIMYVSGQSQIPQGNNIEESNSASKRDDIEGDKIERETKEYVIKR